MIDAGEAVCFLPIDDAHLVVSDHLSPIAALPNQTFAAAVLIQKTPGPLADGPDWLTVLEGKEVAVTGTVEIYKDTPEIVLTAREDLNTAPGK